MAQIGLAAVPTYSSGLIRFMEWLFVVGMFCVLPSAAHAYCYEPSTPSSYRRPTRPIEPTTPYCVNIYAKTHTCDSFTISRYNSEVDTYNTLLESYRLERDRYVSSLKQYVDDAVEYARCEIRRLD
jgi:hypothetical protein